MRGCVGKPTLRVVVSEPFREFLSVDLATRGKLDDRAGKAEPMSRADHRRQGPLAVPRVTGRRGREWPDSPPLGEA